MFIFKDIQSLGQQTERTLRGSLQMTNIYLIDCCAKIKKVMRPSWCNNIHFISYRSEWNTDSFHPCRFIFLIKTVMAGATSRATTTVTTALCLIPPEELWGQIQSIRSKHDKAYPRWMPHINLIYPFVPEEQFGQIKQQLEPILHRHHPFPVRFDPSSFEFFKQKGEDCTYHLRPTGSQRVVELYKTIESNLRHVPTKKRQFEAHLTLGQTTTAHIDDVLREMTAQWTSFDFLVDRVYLISRENHPENLFTIKEEIILLGKDDQSISSSISNTNLDSAHASPKDCLFIQPSKGFCSRILHLFHDIQSFRPSSTSRIVLAELNGPTVDAQLRGKLESTPKFTLHFGPTSISFDAKTSHLCLQTIDLEHIERFNAHTGSQCDGTMILGELNPNDFDQARDRFSRSSQEFAVDRLQLNDSTGRTKFVFRLKASTTDWGNHFVGYANVSHNIFMYQLKYTRRKEDKIHKNEGWRHSWNMCIGMYIEQTRKEKKTIQRIERTTEIK